MIYFSSDHHLFHSKIIKSCNRPFENVNEMNEHLIENINKTVSKKDELYIIGDFSFGNGDETSKILDRIECKRRYLILGNHDKYLNATTKKQFSWIKDYYELKYEIAERISKKICLFHYPIATWHSKHHGSWHIHGHSHGKHSYDYPSSMSIDIGVDSINKLKGEYRPISIDEIVEIFNKNIN